MRVRDHKKQFSTGGWAIAGAGLIVALVLVPMIGAAQTVVYSENFENGMTATTAAGFTSSNVGTGGGTQADTYNMTGVTPIYTSATFLLGPGNTKYTAAVDWLDGAHCDGIVLSQASSQPAWVPTDGTGCNTSSGVQSYAGVQNIVLGIGAYLNNGGVAATYTTTASMPAGSTSNHAVAAYTECDNFGCGTIGSGTGAAPNGLMLRNVTAIPTLGGNRFYTASVVVGAANCTTNPPSYQFVLSDGATTSSVGTVAPCSAGNAVVINVPNQRSFGGTTVPISVVQLAAPTPIKLTGTSLTISMYSMVNATFGNDAAFDNIQVIDVTPTLSKSFNPTSPVQGATSTLTFTVTNTTDLLAKSGWSFTDALPSGLVVATPNGLGGTCASAGATVTATAGSSTITVTNGNLAAGTASCTIIVNVTSATAATYTNGASNVTASYVNPPANATVKFLPKVNVSISKDDGRTTYSPGGTGIYTITVNNTGPGTATGVALADALPPGITLNGTWTCAGVGGSTCSAANGTTMAALNALTLTVPPGTAPPGSSTAITIQLPVTYSNSPANY